MPETDFTTSELYALSKKRTGRALGTLALDSALYFLCVLGILQFRSLFLQFVLSITAGFAVGLLFVVGHDFCHQSFTRHRKLNRLIGRVVFLPSLHPFSTWDLSHNKTHHRYTNQRGHDYVWEPLTLSEYEELPPLLRAKYRLYRTATGHLFYNLTEIWWKRLFFPSPRFIGKWKRDYFFDHAIVLLWLILFPLAQMLYLMIWRGIALGVSATMLPRLVILTMVVPFLYFQFLFSTVVFLHHTHPLVRWYSANDQIDWASAQLANTVHVIFPRPVNRCFQWIMEHTAHHLRPSIPLYNLREAQAALEARCPNIIIHRWTINSHIDVLKCCKLFDPSRGGWCDYHGNPTSRAEQEAAGRPEEAEGLKGPTRDTCWERLSI